MTKRNVFDGTTILAAVMERFAPGRTLNVTRAEIEALAFGTSHPVVFTLIDEDTVEIRVERPADASQN